MNLGEGYSSGIPDRDEVRDMIREEVNRYGRLLERESIGTHYVQTAIVSANIAYERGEDSDAPTDAA